MSTGRRVLFWVQHLLGIGHLMRAGTLARTLAEGGFEVTLVTGGVPVPGFDPGGARLVQLPPVRAVDVHFKVLVDEQGEVVDDAWRARRREAALAAARAARPDLVLTELFPFGRRQLAFEVVPLLEWARARTPPARIACSVRDILVEPPRPERLGEMLERVQAFYDRVLVHGDPALIPFDETFPHADAIRDKLRYTGYVVDERRGGGEAAPPEVIVSAGGGAVSEPLLEAALAARPRTGLRDRPWRFLVGHNLPHPRFRAFARRARAPGVTVERARPDFRRLLGSALLSISQGGYNTVMEVLQAGVPGVVVPYSGGLETEQTLRARLLAERGLIESVTEEALGPETLARAIDRALARPPLERSPVDTGGARRTAELLGELLAE